MNRMDQLRFQVDDPHRLITVGLSGDVSGELLGAMFAHLRSMPEFERTYSVLFDARAISNASVTADELFRIAKLTASDVNRMAIVVTEPMGFGKAQIFEICANWATDRVATLTDLSEARAWLRITPGERAE